MTRIFSEKVSPCATQRPELDEVVKLVGELCAFGIVFTVLAALSGMEREHIRDRTLEGHESARRRGKTIGGADVTDDDVLSMAIHLREREMSLRDTTNRPLRSHPLSGLLTTSRF